MKRITLTAVLLAVMGSAHGVTPFVEAHVGALGVGGELGLDFGRFRVRAQTSEYSYERKEVFDGVEYDTTIELGGEGLIIDLAPFNGSFFFSAGVFDNGVKLGADSEPVVTTIGSAPFTGRVFADADFDDQVPYVGVGWRLFQEPQTRGFGGSLDVGAYLNGEADVTIRTDDPAFNAAFADEIRQEEEDVKEDIKGEEVLPVIKLGLVYYF